MAAALRPLSGEPTRSAPTSLLRFLPAVTLALFLTPILAGLAGTLLPAFGYLPALGGDSLTLEAFVRLVAMPGLATALRLTLVSGLAGTLAAVALTLGLLAACHQRPIILRLRALLAPLLALPHAAVAIGLAFLIAPSGWLVRLLSPWATGWTLPPDLPMLPDPWGLGLGVGLVLKETPFLLLVSLAALTRIDSERRLAIARSLGYGPTTAWIKAVLPALYPQIRLPIYAVLTYALSTVDMAIVLAPASPPPFAVQVLRWFYDPDLSLRFVAAAGAVLQLVLVLAAILAWRLAEIAAARLGRNWLGGGARGGSGRAARVAAEGGLALLLVLSGAGLAAIALWSFAWRWPYPAALPDSWTLATWSQQAGSLSRTAATTLALGLLAATAALLLTLGCLENETRRQVTMTRRALVLLYLPLLVPQIAFLFGTQVLAIQLGFDGSWLALVWGHLLFVLPYVFLALSEPYRALDHRYIEIAYCLGAGPARVFWQVKLPLLRRPVLAALAIGFAVSVAQYLPTVFLGAGRYATLTTEAVTLAGGGDRRVLAATALVQSLLPTLAFLAALAVRQRPGLLARKPEAAA